MDTLQIERKDNYVIVQIDNGKVNAIDTPLAKELRETFLDLEKDDGVKGVLLIGRPHCFSAGLNIMHLATIGLDGTKVFWEEYLGALQAMIRFSKPLVCGITGYAQAAGTSLALCADYRVMAKGDKYVMGMNEFNMSLLIPELLCDIFAYHIGEKHAWEAVQTAKMYNSDASKTIGLVNESVEMEEVVPRAEKYLKRLMNVHLPVYAKSKEYLRKDLLKKIDRDIDDMVEPIMKNAADPATQKMIQMFMASIKKS